jgi:hypothetical protein
MTELNAILSCGCTGGDSGRAQVLDRTASALPPDFKKSTSSAPGRGPETRAPKWRGTRSSRCGSDNKLAIKRFGFRDLCQCGLASLRRRRKSLVLEQRARRRLQRRDGLTPQATLGRIRLPESAPTPLGGPKRNRLFVREPGPARRTSTTQGRRWTPPVSLNRARSGKAVTGRHWDWRAIATGARGLVSS